MPLERSQPVFTSIICAHKATNIENWTKIGCLHFEIIGLKGIVKTGSTLDS